jgi:hypothetical protein
MTFLAIGGKPGRSSIKRTNADPISNLFFFPIMRLIRSAGVENILSDGRWSRAGVGGEDRLLFAPWSASPVEGQITRLKAIKRSMHGRAGFHLLRQRVLMAA